MALARASHDLEPSTPRSSTRLRLVRVMVDGDNLTYELTVAGSQGNGLCPIFRRQPEVKAATSVRIRMNVGEFSAHNDGLAIQRYIKRNSQRSRPGKRRPTWLFDNALERERPVGLLGDHLVAACLVKFNMRDAVSDAERLTRSRWKCECLHVVSNRFDGCAHRRSRGRMCARPARGDRHRQHDQQQHRAWIVRGRVRPRAHKVLAPSICSSFGETRPQETDRCTDLLVVTTGQVVDPVCQLRGAPRRISRRAGLTA